MKIQTIEITNYKAFLGTHKFNVGGKNLFIYGENGSGKSSLYYALKDFFQASIEDIDLAELENAFVLEADKGKTSIKVSFKSNPASGKGSKEFLWNSAVIDSRDAGVITSYSIHYTKLYDTDEAIKLIENSGNDPFFLYFPLTVNQSLAARLYRLSLPPPVAGV